MDSYIDKMQNTINLKKQPNQIPKPIKTELKPRLIPRPEPSAKTPEIGSKNIHNKISWSGPMSSHEPDNRFVILVSGGLILGAILSQIFQGNIITTIFLGLLGVMVFVQSRKESEDGHFEIGPAGIQVNNKLHYFKEIRSFWIEYQPEGIKELSLQFNRWYAPYLKIPIGNMNPLQIRVMLVLFIPEEV